MVGPLQVGFLSNWAFSPQRTPAELLPQAARPTKGISLTTKDALLLDPDRGVSTRSNLEVQDKPWPVAISSRDEPPDPVFLGLRLAIRKVPI